MADELMDVDDIDVYDDLDVEDDTESGAEQRTKPAADESKDSGGLRGAADAVRDRLSLSIPGVGGGRREERLISVVNESEAGSTLDLLRQNKNFSLYGAEAHVILVLPTRDPEFGGLSSRQSSSEDKGMIINLVQSDNIHGVATPALFEDDALGLIPDEQSLLRMSEFRILRHARYLYGVVVSDIDDGGLRVFTVPPKRAESQDGRLFDEVGLVQTDELGLGAVVDTDLIRVMLKIYRSPEGGAAALEHAVEMNLDLTVSSLKLGEYPTGEDLIDHLAMEFPMVAQMRGGSVATQGAPVGGRHAVPDTGEEVEEETAVADDQVTESEVETDEADQDEGVSDTAQDEQDPVTEEPALPQEAEAIFGAPAPSAEVDFDDLGGGGEAESEAVTALAEAAVDSVSEDAESEAQQEDPLPVSRALATAKDKVGGDELRAVLGAIEKFGGRMESLEAAVRRGPTSFDPGAGENDPRVIEVESGPDGGGGSFSYGQVVAEAQRRYFSEDLNLEVTAEPFNARLASEVVLLTVPAGPKRTPWLDEQIRQLIEGLNNELVTLHVENQRSLKNQFFALSDRAVVDILDELDLESGGSSAIAKAYRAIQNDREMLTSQYQQMRQAAEEETRQAWERREEQFVTDAGARARTEFRRRFTPKIEADVQASGERIQQLGSALIDESLATLNEQRIKYGRERLDEQLIVIVDRLEEVAAEHQKTESEAYEACRSAIMDYIEAHRDEDVGRAEVIARQLDKDTRVEEALAETQRKLTEQRSDMAERLRLREEQWDDEKRALQARIDREQQAKVELQSEQAAARQNWDEEGQRKDAQHRRQLQEMQDSAELRVRNAEESRDQAYREKEAAAAEMSRRQTVTWSLVVLAVLVAIGLGVIVGSQLMG